jgi:hypothetical protein
LVVPVGAAKRLAARNLMTRRLRRLFWHPGSASGSSLVDQLKHNGLYLTDQVINQALALLGE